MIKICLLILITFSFENARSQKEIQDENSILERIHQNVGKNFLPFSSNSLNSKRYANQNLKGKFTLVNFWFESCEPCIAEFAALNRIYEAYKSFKKFQFISFTFESQKDALNIAKKYSLIYPIICLTRKKCDYLNYRSGYPTTMIINTSGKIVYIKAGGPTDSLEVEKVINSTLIPNLNELLKN